MKIIHTSDWHLGQNFFEYDRRDEHSSMVNQLVELVKCEKPDALVIAGDIYDIPAPGISVQKEFAEYMVALHTGCPQMKIICISGNHDSASRHEIYQTPWEALNVHMVGKADMENPENNIIQIGEKGWVVAVPYTNERFLDDDFFKSLEQVTKEKTGEKLPIVYVGHAAIRDSKIDYTGHQIQGMSISSEKLTSDDFRFVGGIECTDIKELGDVYDYVALGHIHKAQTFNGGRARYCGSPLPVSFDEVRPGYEHGFSIVEIESHGASPIITTKEVTTPCPLVNIPSSGFAAWSDAMKDEIWNNGYFATYKGHRVIVLPQSFEDNIGKEATYADKVIDPSLAYIIPTGAEKPVKVAFEGAAQVKSFDNRDWSTEIQTYQKLGVATYMVNPGICIYQNTALKKYIGTK